MKYLVMYRSKCAISHKPFSFHFFDFDAEDEVKRYTMSLIDIASLEGSRGI